MNSKERKESENKLPVTALLCLLILLSPKVVIVYLVLAVGVSSRTRRRAKIGLTPKGRPRISVWCGVRVKQYLSSLVLLFCGLKLSFDCFVELIDLA